MATTLKQLRKERRLKGLAQCFLVGSNPLVLKDAMVKFDRGV